MAKVAIGRQQTSVMVSLAISMVISSTIVGLGMWLVGAPILENFTRGLRQPPLYQKYYNYYNLSACEHVYIDVGVPAADTIDAFVQAGNGAAAITRIARDMRRGHSFAPPFDAKEPRMMGYDYVPFLQRIHGVLAQTKTSPKDWCVVGLDANPEWALFFHEFKQQDDRKRLLGRHETKLLRLEAWA